MSSNSGDGLGPSLFQVREPRRRFLGPFVLVILLHAGVVFWTSRAVVEPIRPAAEPVKVVFRLPARKLASNEPPGGPPPPARRHRPRRRVQPPKEIPPPVLETPPLPEVPDPPKVAEAEEAGDDDADEGDPGEGSGSGGGGSGTGRGHGTGPGDDTVSKARMAWLTHTDWRCRRPGHEDLGRVIVRIRVHVEPDGKPRQVTVVRPGPEDFNRRAIDCALDESYFPALDRDGHPIPGDCEFGIEFVN